MLLLSREGRRVSYRLEGGLEAVIYGLDAERKNVVRGIGEVYVP